MYPWVSPTAIDIEPLRGLIDLKITLEYLLSKAFKF